MMPNRPAALFERRHENSQLLVTLNFSAVPQQYSHRSNVRILLSSAPLERPRVDSSVLTLSADEGVVAEVTGD